MSRITLVLSLLVLGLSGQVRGQEPTLMSGAHVRIVTTNPQSAPLVGTIVAWLPDRLLLTRGEAEDSIVAVSRVSVDHIDISVRRFSPATVLTYAGLGLLVGAAGGALAGPVVMSSACLAWRKDIANQGSCVGDLVDSGKRIEAALLFGGIGTAVGIVAGAIVGRERWQKLAPANVRVALASQRLTGLTLAASVRF